MPEIWAWLDALLKEPRPALLRDVVTGLEHQILLYIH